jgi:hypothetical protein
MLLPLDVAVRQARRFWRGNGVRNLCCGVSSVGREGGSRVRRRGHGHWRFARCGRALLIRILPVPSGISGTRPSLPGQRGACRNAGPAGVRADAGEARPAVMMVLIVFPGRPRGAPGCRGRNGQGGSVTFQDSDDEMNVQVIPEPGTGNREPGTGIRQPVSGRPWAGGGNRYPVAGTRCPVGRGREPVAGNREPVGWGPESGARGGLKPGRAPGGGHGRGGASLCDRMRPSKQTGEETGQSDASAPARGTFKRAACGQRGCGADEVRACRRGWCSIRLRVVRTGGTGVERYLRPEVPPSSASLYPHLRRTRLPNLTDWPQDAAARQREPLGQLRVATGASPWKQGG